MQYLNKSRKPYAILLALLMLLSLAPVQVMAADNTQNADVCSEEAAGYIVKIKKPEAKRMRTMESETEGLEPISAENGIYLVRTEADLAELPADELICVEPNYKLQLLDTEVDDELFLEGEQWDLLNMNVPTAWAMGQNGAGVTVAVIDSGLFGVNFSEKHEDVDSSKVVKQYNFIDDNLQVIDEKGHGTFVCGQIFAKTNNGKGVAGLMPGTRIMPLKVFGEDDAYTSDVISAIYYAVENNAQVINMSLGGYEKSELLEEACEAAVDAGVLLVAAAGNGGSSAPVYPAAFDCVIGVGATTKENTHYTNSQYGQSVFAVAPGDRICGLRNAANSYCYRSGTSMAAPAVSALGAMAKSINPKMTQNEFKQLLERTSIDLGDEGIDSVFGCGLVDFGKAAQVLLDEKIHNYGAWESDGPDSHSRSCTDEGCGARAAEEHIWGDAANICGGITFTCTLCGQTKTVPADWLHYADVSVDKWYHEAIHACTSAGYFRGVTPTSFAPNAKMTRAMFVTVMYRMAGEPDVSGLSMPFTDVAAGSWSHDAIVWAYNEGITNGVSDVLFKPNDLISRAQLVTMLYRAEGSPSVSGDAAFSDSKSFAAWSVSAIIWASENEIVKGYPDNSFKPNNTATRAEMATVVYRYMQ